MKLFTSIVLTTLGLLFFASQVFPWEPYKSDWAWRSGFKEHNQRHYSLSDKNGVQNRIQFIRFSYVPKNWYNYYEISNEIEKKMKATTRCHVAGDWYYTEISNNHPRIAVFAWLNLNHNYLGWVAINRQYRTWYITTSRMMKWYNQKEYPFYEVEEEWPANGMKIRIELRDPNDENGWTESDLWYKFSFY